MPIQQATKSLLERRFANLQFCEFRGGTRITFSSEDCFSALTMLKQDLAFDYLVDITCVDYLHYRGAKDRFGLIYLVVNTETNESLTVKVMLNEPHLNVPSVVPLWEGANWLEREVWDMFGIRFDGHPDLRRILTPEEFTAHPLRKDYPLQGRGERHNFPVLTRNQA